MTTEELALPANHRLILTVIRESGVGSHLDATEIMVRARRQQPHVGLATVHRALARLHELGFVSKVEVAGSPSSTYEPVADAHAHFLCTRCGAISDVDYTIPTRTLHAIAERANIEIQSESLTLRGRCTACRTERV